MVDDYDSPWKEAIERYFSDFMLFFFPYAHSEIDWGQPLWMMWLPEFMEPEFRLRVEEMEEGKTMRYVTSIERLAMKEGVEKGILQGIEQGMQQGMQQGKQQGRLEGKVQVLIRLLAARFGPLPERARARLDAATEAELERWTDAFVNADSIEQVLGSARD